MNYECQSWQGLLQQLVQLPGKGYHFYRMQQLPEQKKDSWRDIDNKLILKFRAGLSKFQRARQKVKKIANYKYLRWNGTIIIMHTLGTVPESLRCEEFRLVKKEPIPIKVSDNIAMLVYFDEETCKFSARLSNESYRGFKAVLDNACKLNRERVKVEFGKLNGLPAWHGIISQKKALARYAIQEARRHNIQICRADLRLATMRKIYPIYTPQL